MRYRTEHTCRKIHDEYYECNECGKQYEQYNMLNHPSDETGGFCWCGSEDLKVMRLVTVYQEFYAPEDYDTEDTMQVAYELDDWKVSDFITRFNGEQK